MRNWTDRPTTPLEEEWLADYYDDPVEEPDLEADHLLEQWRHRVRRLAREERYG